MMPICFIAACMVLTAVTKFTISACDAKPHVAAATPAVLNDTVVVVLTSFVLVL